MPHCGRFKALFQKPANEQVAELIQVANGQKSQVGKGVYSAEYATRLELITLRHSLFLKTEKINELKDLPPSVKEFVGACSRTGVEGQNMCRVMDMYVSGKLQDKACFGMLMGSIENTKRDARGTGTRGIQIQKSVFNFLIGLSKVATKRAVKFASLNLLGFEINLANMRRHTTRILDLKGDEKLELIDPTDEELRTMVDTLLRGLRCGEEPLVATHMDPSKLAGTLQYCSRRMAVLGGDTLAGYAKAPVQDKSNAADFMASMANIVPADQANIFAFSPAKAGFPAMEILALPERHHRKGLPAEQIALLKAPTTAASVFAQADRYFAVLSARNTRVASFGCDGGVHGMSVIESLHQTTGRQLKIVTTRTVEDMSGTLLAALGVQLVICKTAAGVIAGVLDPPHILKRVQEQLASGAHFLQLAPRLYSSFAYWRLAGVASEIIVKPDAMSDKLTRDAFASAVMCQLRDNSPATIDPTGTIILLFLIGESVDAAMLDGMSDIERIARLYLGEVMLTVFREFSKTVYKGSLTALSMATLTLHNYQKMCNAFLGLILEWANDYPNDPFYAPSHGSLRLETTFSIRRGQCDSFGLLDLANHQLRDLAVSALVAKGDLKYQSSNKGYVSFEERMMAPTSFRFTPKPILKGVILDADATARSLMRLLGIKEVTRSAGTTTGTTVEAVEPADDTGVTVEPIVDAPKEAQAAEAEMDIDALMLLGDVAGAAERAATALDILGEVASDAPCSAEETPDHLQESADLVAATIAARELDAGLDPEGEAEEALAAVATTETPLDLGLASKRGAGATVECAPQLEQRKSTYLERIDTAIRTGDLSALINMFIELRKETEVLAGTSAKAMQRTAAQAKAHEDTLAKCRSSVKLQHGEKEIDPSHALRLQRQGVVEQFNAQRKRARLQRWMEGTKIMSGSGLLAEGEPTIEAGQLWFYAANATTVVLVVVLPFHSFKNGLRPWTSLSEPMKLKEMKSVQLVVCDPHPMLHANPSCLHLPTVPFAVQVFKPTSITTAQGGRIFKMADPILERTSRRLMVKVLDSATDVTNVRSSGTLELLAEGLAMQTQCESVVKSLMASLSKPLSTPAS